MPLTAVSFTLFAHFYNVFALDGVLWNRAGYYYPNAPTGGACQSSNYEDSFGNWLIRNGHGHFNLRSEAFPRYQEPLKQGVDQQLYKLQFDDQDVRNIHFWPITNLAEPWYSSFIKTRYRNQHGFPANLAHLGPVVHAGADASVPYHATGVSGCGHREYEAMVEKLYLDDPEHSLLDRSMVRNNLLTESFLTHQTSLENILEGSAFQAVADCKRDAVESCLVLSIHDPQKAKRLVNLAISTTVVLIRKALLDWNPKSPRGTVNENIASIKDHDLDSYYSDWSEITTSDLLQASVSSREFGELIEHVEQIKRAIAQHQNLKTLVPLPEFRKHFVAIVRSAIEYVRESKSYHLPPFEESPGMKIYPTMPNVGRVPIRFRPPTSAEIDSNERWKSYLQERMVFKASLELYQRIIGLIKLEASTEVRTSDEEIENLLKPTDEHKSGATPERSHELAPSATETEPSTSAACVFRLPWAYEGPKEPLIDINTATLEELENRICIGYSSSKKILAGRPYKRKDELVQKNIIPKSTYDAIEQEIMAGQK